MESLKIESERRLKEANRLTPARRGAFTTRDINTTTSAFRFWRSQRAPQQLAGAVRPFRGSRVARRRPPVPKHRASPQNRIARVARVFEPDFDNRRPATSGVGSVSAGELRRRRRTPKGVFPERSDDAPATSDAS